MALRAAEVFRPEPAPALRAASKSPVDVARPNGKPAAAPENTGAAATDSGARGRPVGEASAEPGAAALDAGTAAV